MEENELKALRANQYFLVREFERRGIKVSALDLENELLEARYGNHVEHLLNIDSSLMSYTASVVSGQKWVAKKILKSAGISVPAGTPFLAAEPEKALLFAARARYPLVIKPVFGIQGEEVHTGVEYAAEILPIVSGIRERHGNIPLLIEEQFEAVEYRIFVTRSGNTAVLHRDPAHVTGNGYDSIERLVETESFRRTHPRSNCLCPILLDEVVDKFLRKSGRTLQHVPAKGEKVYLRGNSNVKSGGMCEDVTDSVHASVIEIAARVLSAFPCMPYAGIDFMTRDISAAQTAADYRIIEVNSLPGIGIHMAPGKGKARNVAGWLADMIFPETERSEAA